jgi:predicted amidohydrolase
MAVTEDVASNAASIQRAIDFAARMGADVLLTPEGSLSGYTPHFDPVEVARALDEVRAAAAASGVALALGTCFAEPDDGRTYNEVRFYDRTGTFLGFHTKTLLCGTLDDPPSGEINDYGVRPLRTFEMFGVRVGALICNDLWANPGCTPMDDPHLVLKLARMGVRVIFHAVNGGRDGGEWWQTAWNYHESNLQLRAQAAGVWIVTVDNAHPVTLPCSAPSGIVGPSGRWLVRAERQGECFFTADVPLGGNP